MEKNHRQTQKKQNRHHVKRIHVLPDEVLLDIFDFYMNICSQSGVKREIEAWQPLVHVCRRWRILVLGSPRRLNLRLCCTPKTPAKDTMDVWPALPLIIAGKLSHSDTDNPDLSTNDLATALGQSNRVHEVNLSNLGDERLEEVLAAMQVPFPGLTNLQLQQLYSWDKTPVIPDSFLGGSSPRLQYFSLSGIPFPGLPNLLLSATHLIRLDLCDLPYSGLGCISPKAILSLLSALSSLRIFSIGFQDYEYVDWESQNLPSPKRSILPALMKLHVKGPTRYLEELVTRIDTPQLYYMDITFIESDDTSRLTQFINSTPTLRALDEGHDVFHPYPYVTLRYRTSEFRFDKLLISVPYMELSWEISLTLVCQRNSSLRPLSMIEDLYIYHAYLKLVSKNDVVKSTWWSRVLLPFTAVKNLYLSKVFVLGIMGTLQEPVDAMKTELLPSLQNIFVEGLEPSGSFQENIAEFVAARQLSDHPITVSVWYKDSTVEPM